ncbi:unnamed protein product, partial [Didymodactylos carnosus]
REIQVEENYLNTFATKLRTIASHLSVQERQQTQSEINKIETALDQLRQHAEKRKELKINDIIYRINQKWKDIEIKLEQLTKPSKDIVDEWRKFNSSYVNLLDRLGELEAKWYSIQREKFTSTTEILLNKAKLDFDVLQLHERSQNLCQYVLQIASKNIDTH